MNKDYMKNLDAKNFKILVKDLIFDSSKYKDTNIKETIKRMEEIIKAKKELLNEERQKENFNSDTIHSIKMDIWDFEHYIEELKKKL